MAKHKVAELEGALLDAAVAKAEGLEPAGEPWWPRYSTDWSHAGPIIERERISVFPRLNNLFEPIDWAAVKHVYPEPGEDRLPDGNRFRIIEQHAQTPLTAAMRAYVSSKFGEEVELP